MASRKKITQVYPIQGLEWRALTDEGLSNQGVIIASKKGAPAESSSQRHSTQFSQSVVPLSNVVDFIVSKAAVGTSKWGIKENGVARNALRTFLNFTGGVTITDNPIDDELTIDITGGTGGAVDSVFGRTGIVIAQTGDYNSDQVTEGGANLYFTDARVSASPAVAANTAKVSADGSVTTHIDISSAGSGIIISVAERSAITANTLKVSADGSINTHSDVDTITTTPSVGNVLEWDGTNWVPATPTATAPVDSVFSRTGVVVAQAGDYSADQVTYDNASSGLAALQVQAALDEIKGITDGLSGGVNYLGEFDPQNPPPAPQDGANTPGQPNDGIDSGDFYIVNTVGGPVFWDFATGTPSAGPAVGRVVELDTGYRVLYNEVLQQWDDISPTEGVQSVFGRTGVVVAQTGDYDTDQVPEGATNFYFTDARFDTRFATRSVIELTDVSDAGSGAIITTAERAEIAANTLKISADGSVTTHSDVTDAGSGAIITTAERNAIAANTLKVSADGSVTTHNDVTDAGSGQIITAAERVEITHSNRTLLDSLIDSGTGDNFLADDGTYKAIDTSLQGDNGIEIDTGTTPDTVKIEDVQYLAIQHSWSTGIISGGVISVNAGNPATFDVTAGVGRVIDNTNPTAPDVSDVSWSAQTGIAVPDLASAITSYVRIDRNGVVEVLANSPTQEIFRTHIVLGLLVHFSQVQIDNVIERSFTSHDYGGHIIDLGVAIGNVKLQGNIISGNNDLTFQKSFGRTYQIGTDPQFVLDPNTIDNPLLDPVIFNYIFRDGAGGFTVVPGQNDIDPTQWDNNSGTLDNVGSSRWTFQTVLLEPSTNTITVAYGQEIFRSEVEALQGIALGVELPEELAQATLILGWIAVRGNAVDLSDDAFADFVQANKFGDFGGAGSASVATEASQVEYNPTNPGDWNPIPDNVSDALDQAISGGSAGLDADIDRVLFSSNLDNVQTIFYFGNQYDFTGENFDINVLDSVGYETSTDGITFTSQPDLTSVNTFITGLGATDPWYLRVTASYSSGQTITTGLELIYSR